MSRKPIDKQQPTECRQAIWEWIRENEKENGPMAVFRQHEMDICLDPGSIREYLTGLAKAGYLVATTYKKRGQATLFTLVKDTGIEAPRVRRDGTAVTQGQGRRQMWNAMQVLKVFSPRDLAFNSGTESHTVAESEAKTYCHLLSLAGYLVARDGGKYALIATKWSGPQPPQIQRTRQIYDPNLKKVVWSRVEGGAE